MKNLIGLALAIASAFGVSWPSLSLSGSAHAQGVSDRAKHEIERRGAMVEVIHNDGKIRDDGLGQVREAMATPASDAHKFILHVITTAGCAPCERLKKDLETAAELAKWVKLERIRQANGVELLQSSDESFLHVIFESPQPPGRKERFAGVKISTYPTLLLTPSLNGQWGDPAKVIRQLDGYNGKPGELDQWLTRTISEHAKKFQPAYGDRGSVDELLHLVDAPAYTNNPYGPNPFPAPSPAPAPYPQPYPVLPVGPLPIDVTPVPAPAPAPAPGTLWTVLYTLLGVGGAGGAIGLAFVVWSLYRAVLRSQGKTPLLTDAEVAELKKLLVK